MRVSCIILVRKSLNTLNHVKRYLSIFTYMLQIFALQLLNKGSFRGKRYPLTTSQFSFSPNQVNQLENCKSESVKKLTRLLPLEIRFSTQHHILGSVYALLIVLVFLDSLPESIISYGLLNRPSHH